MPTIHMMMGVPGSGKSYQAQVLAEKHQAVYLSSDALRKELYGDERIQEDHKAVFAELHKRTKEALESGKDVIYDATNVSRKKRLHFLTQEMKDYPVVGHVLVTPFLTCVSRDIHRERTVGKGVIKRMLENFQFPLQSEGFSDIVYYATEQPHLPKREMFEHVLLDDVSYEAFYDVLLDIPEFDYVFEVPHDSTYHAFSISRHIYYVYQNVHTKYHGTEQLLMRWTSAFHDLGKGFCKRFQNRKGQTTRYAHYYGHENVSAYLAYHYLTNLGYDQAFVLQVVELVSLHMLPKETTEYKVKEANEQGELVEVTKKVLNKKVDKRLRNWLTQEQYDRLLLFNECDNEAK